MTNRAEFSGKSRFHIREIIESQQSTRIQRTAQLVLLAQKGICTSHSYLALRKSSNLKSLFLIEILRKVQSKLLYELKSREISEITDEVVKESLFCSNLRNLLLLFTAIVPRQSNFPKSKVSNIKNTRILRTPEVVSTSLR